MEIKKSHMSAFKTSDVFTNSYKTSDWIWFNISYNGSFLGKVLTRNYKHAVWRWLELNNTWCRKINELRSVPCEVENVKQNQ